MVAMYPPSEVFPGFDDQIGIKRIGAVGLRCKTALFVADESQQRFVDRLPRVDLGKQRHWAAEAKNMGEVKQSKLRNVEGAVLDFGKAAAGDFPAGELQAVTQF